MRGLYGCDRTRRFTLEVVDGDGFTGKLQAAPTTVNFGGGATPTWGTSQGSLNGVSTPGVFITRIFSLEGRGQEPEALVHLDFENLATLGTGPGGFVGQIADAFENGGIVTLSVTTDGLNRTLTLKLGSEPYP